MPPTPPPWTRRTFVTAALAATISGCKNLFGGDSTPEDPARITATPAPPTQIATLGMQALGVASPRDGYLYVPPSYRAAQPTPLVVLLHGAGGSSAQWADPATLALLDEFGVVALAPDSRLASWDIKYGAYGADVAFISQALTQVFRRVNVDAARICLAGFSDGASYALSLGLTNGDLFTALMAFSPGFLQAAALRGKPRIFVSHGVDDPVLSIDSTSRKLVPALQAAGYPVHYSEFAGVHEVPNAIEREAFVWFS